jgi:hypothetical protein
MANTYGDTGNRWWAGMNVGEGGGNQTIFGTASISALNPFAPSGYQPLPSGNAADDAQFAAAAKTNKGNASPNTISVRQVNWYNIQGPFTTKAAANAAIPAIQKANPSPGVLGQVQKDNRNNPVGAAIKGITSLSDFLNVLGQPNTWLRIVKIIAGGIIMTVGIMKLTGADKAAGGFAAKAVKVAPLL